MYKLPNENQQQQQEFQNHEAVLPRIISSPRSREVANNYIDQAPFEDKLIITRMLNEWNRETFPIQEAKNVIRPEAVPVIKDWLNTAEDKEIAIAKNLLAHLSEEKKRTDDVQTRNSPRRRTSASRSDSRPSSTRSGQNSNSNSRPVSNNGGRKGSRLGSSNGGRRSSSSNQPQRPPLRPRTSITYGSFYPQQTDGFGNNTGVFNIVRGQPRPKTMLSKAQQYREKYHNKAQESPREATFNPVNRSGVFGTVIFPVQQGTYSRPGTRQSRPGSQALGRRPSTQGQLRKQNSDERLKFSANLQSKDDIQQLDIETDRSEGNNKQQSETHRSIEEKKEPVMYYPQLNTYRDLGLKKHWPGRPYHNTNLLLG